MEFTRKTLLRQHYIYVERQCPYGPEVSAAMGDAFGAVFGFVGAQGITPLGMPMSVYLEMDPEVLKFRGGVIVSEADAMKATDPIKRDVLPAGEAMFTLHVGGYDTLGKTHQALWDHMKAEGLNATMPVWEIYIDDPGDTAEADLRTEIYRAMA